MSDSVRATARYIQLTSVVRAIRWHRNRSKTSLRDAWTVGPTSSISFRDTPDEDLADASNTARIFVVVLESFGTACMGR